MKKLVAVVFTAASLGVLAMPAFSADVPEIVFQLKPNPKFAACLGVPGGPTPSAQVVVQRGELNDTLILRAAHLRPNLGFDLFTTENSNLLSNGTPDPNFKNFGLAWYQSDVQADSNGNAEVAVKTILLDQIFGFDPSEPLDPTHTFHIGFWFNSPDEAAACGFAGPPTPFNGEQHAGPNAMMSVPNFYTHLGPLCTHAKKEGTTYVCSE
ncbi:MAG TPA: hypothetical protein VH351_19545 [Bryobacteraceae bacterium]|nr:hypothetical protein [Bryobacteraceae bacterium]